eukprot:scaffold107810_cov56-Phaeocystis_antarctica.AAC.1
MPSKQKVVGAEVYDISLQWGLALTLQRALWVGLVAVSTGPTGGLTPTTTGLKRARACLSALLPANRKVGTLQGTRHAATRPKGGAKPNTNVVLS